MGGMFYSLQEVMGKLKKTEDEVSALVKQGRLREFRDGPNLLFKIDEVNSLMSDTTFMAAQTPPKTDEEEVSLILDGDEQADKSKDKSSDTTAVAGEGINVLGETQTEISMTEDTLADTMAASAGATSIIDNSLGGTKAASDEASLQEIEENVNLDTFGSGSGLLDLSLQADDTSLGGILDDIFRTPEGEEGKEKAKEGTAADIVAESDQIIEPQEQAVPTAEAELEVVSAATSTEAVAYIAEPLPDMKSNMLGIMLFIPLLATIYTIVVALIGQKNISSPVLGLKGLIWGVVLGGWVVCGLMAGASLMVGGTKTPKVKKEKKPKKDKKAKKEETPVAEAPAAKAAQEERAKTEVTEEMPKLEPEVGTAESADLFAAESGSGEPDFDLDLSDIKDIKDEDKL